MSTAMQRPQRMTVAQFQDWRPPAGLEDRRWHLIDGEPICMSPASIDHGAIQGEAAWLLRSHLLTHRPSCRVIIAPGIIPRILSNTNQRVPDLAVTCAPPRAEPALTDPILVIEILSPSNEADTRRNVWAYGSIPTVTEILLLASTAIGAELLRRSPAGDWPADPILVPAEGTLHLDSIGFAAPLRAFYAQTSLIGRHPAYQQ
jgi:Uma2 family endonuclease